jgi:hypothetical protein
MQKWEYKVHYTKNSPTAEDLNWGEDGWELVTVILGTDYQGNKSFVAYFKKPISD